MVNVDDDGIKMFGMILLVAIILILLSTCYLKEETGGDEHDCLEGTYYLEKFNCCTIDGLTCYVPPTGCVEVPCNDEITCCVPDVCELQQNGSEKCKPCSLISPCNPLVKSSCCKNMFCDALTSFCADCEAQKCYAIGYPYDCCPNYECVKSIPSPEVVGKCTTCDRKCLLDEDCCSGWECTIDKCENCDKSCDPLNLCCGTDKCNSYTNKCEGCVEGAYCNVDKPCCPGMECNLDIDKCEDCNRPCINPTDCCKNGRCVNNICEYGCVNSFCEVPGEMCTEICYESGDCEKCSDNVVCVSTGTMFNICKNIGDCPNGQYDCSMDGKGCNCCDILTGECSNLESNTVCNIEGCTECSCAPSYYVKLCPKGNYLCNVAGGGCFNPSNVYSNADGFFELRNDVCNKCKQVTTDSNACCTYYVPDNAIPSQIIRVNYAVCISGYKTKSGSCVSGVSYTYDSTSKMYAYSYNIVGSQGGYTGVSSVGPSEIVISNVFIPRDSECNSIINDPEDLFDVTFTIPLDYLVGSGGDE